MKTELVKRQVICGDLMEARFTPVGGSVHRPAHAVFRADQFRGPCGGQFPGHGVMADRPGAGYEQPDNSLMVVVQPNGFASVPVEPAGPGEDAATARLPWSARARTPGGICPCPGRTPTTHDRQPGEPFNARGARGAKGTQENFREKRMGRGGRVQRAGFRGSQYSISNKEYPMSKGRARLGVARILPRSAGLRPARILSPGTRQEPRVTKVIGCVAVIPSGVEWISA